MELFLAIAICAAFVVFFALSLLYFSLDRLRTRCQMIWSAYRKRAAAWMDRDFSSKKTEKQIEEFNAVRRGTIRPDPEWWFDFRDDFLDAAASYHKRMEAPVFRWVARVMRFKKMPEID